jgi:DNA-binding XRE family transcriptional regulator
LNGGGDSAYEAHVISPLTLAAIKAKLPKPWMAVVDGQILRKLRDDFGLSQKALAESAGVSLKIAKRLEDGPSARCMPYIAGRLVLALNEDHTVIVRELVSIAPKSDSNNGGTAGHDETQEPASEKPGDDGRPPGERV